MQHEAAITIHGVACTRDGEQLAFADGTRGMIRYSPSFDWYELSYAGAEYFYRVRATIAEEAYAVLARALAGKPVVLDMVEITAYEESA